MKLKFKVLNICALACVLLLILVALYYRQEDISAANRINAYSKMAVKCQNSNDIEGSHFWIRQIQLEYIRQYEEPLLK